MKQEQILEPFASKNFHNDAIILRLKKLESQKTIIKIIYNDKLFWKLRTSNISLSRHNSCVN